MLQLAPSSVTSHPTYFVSGQETVTRSCSFDAVTHLVNLKMSVSSVADGLPKEIKRSFRYSALLTLQKFA